LVQSGQLVRDAWLVRLPDSNDLLPPGSESHGEAPGRRVIVSDRPGADRRGGPERRGGPDRRQLGERRLFDRRLSAR
jgi:hypothetical protein